MKMCFVSTFNSLSDIMLEEFESIRSELNDRSSVAHSSLAPTVQHLTLLCSKYESDLRQLSIKQANLENQISTIQTRPYDDEISELHTKINSTGQEYKTFYDQISDILNSLDGEITTFKSKQNEMSDQISYFRSSISDLHQKYKLSSKNYLKTIFLIFFKLMYNSFYFIDDHYLGSANKEK